MAKTKKGKNSSKPGVKVRDLKPEKNPKGGAGFLKIEGSPALKIDNAIKLNSTLTNTSNYLKIK